MQKKKKNKNILKIASATSLSIFSLLSVFIATWAWFAMNQNVGAGGMNIQISRLDGRLKYVYFHSFLESSSGTNTFKFNKTPFTTYEYDWDDKQIHTITQSNNASDWIIGNYSYERKDHCMLIIFAFDKEYTSSAPGDIFVKGVTTVGGDDLATTYSAETGEALETTGGGFLGARNENGGPLYTLPQTQVNDAEHPGNILMKREPILNAQGEPTYDNQGHQKFNDYYALSSVASFSYQTFDSDSYEDFTGGEGTTLDFPKNSLQEGEAFTTIKTGTGKYVFNQTPYVYKSDGHSTIQYVALVINYSPEAVGYIYSTYLGDDGLKSYDEGLIYFACDWRFEVF